MGEIQYQFDGQRDKKDMEYVPVQFKMPLERKRDLQLYAMQKGYRTITNLLNLLIAKLLENERIMHDPKILRPIDQAIQEVEELLPIIRRYRHDHRQMDNVNNV